MDWLRKVRKVKWFIQTWFGSYSQSLKYSSRSLISHFQIQAPNRGLQLKWNQSKKKIQRAKIPTSTQHTWSAQLLLTASHRLLLEKVLPADEILVRLFSISGHIQSLYSSEEPNDSFDFPFGWVRSSCSSLVYWHWRTSTYQFLWCKYSHHSQFQTTDLISIRWQYNNIYKSQYRLASKWAAFSTALPEQSPSQWVANRTG